MHEPFFSHLVYFSIHDSNLILQIIICLSLGAIRKYQGELEGKSWQAKSFSLSKQSAFRFIVSVQARLSQGRKEQLSEFALYLYRITRFVLSIKLAIWGGRAPDTEGAKKIEGTGEKREEAKRGSERKSSARACSFDVDTEFGMGFLLARIIRKLSELLVKNNLSSRLLFFTGLGV